MMIWNRQQCEDEALRSHQRSIGKEVTASRIECFVHGRNHCHVARPPIRVRIIKTPDELLLHWVGEYLDPKWCVEPLEAIDGLDATSHWIYDPTSWHEGHGPV